MHRWREGLMPAIKKEDAFLLDLEWMSFVVGGGEMVVWPPAFAKKQFLKIFNEISSEH